MTGKNFWVLIAVGWIACGGSGQKETVSLSNDPAEFQAVVSGLKGELVIQNKNGIPFTISQNGSVRFPESWTTDLEYSLRVLDEPCEQRCTIQNPKGTLQGISTVVIECGAKSWNIPREINQSQSFQGTSASKPEIVMNKRGDSILLWGQSDFSNLQIYKKEYRDREWIAPESLGDRVSIPGLNITSKSAAMNDEGLSILMWGQRIGAGYRLFAGMYLGDNWDLPMKDTQAFGYNTRDIGTQPIETRMSESGSGVAVWNEDVAGTRRIFVAQFDNGVWTRPSAFADGISPAGTDAESQDVAMDQNGNIIIVWKQSDGHHDQIYKAEYRNGLWSYPLNLADHISPGGRDAQGPKVAMNDQGRAMIVWSQGVSPNISKIFKSEYQSSLWSHPISLTDYPNLDSDTLTTPAIVMNNSGKTVITFRRLDTHVNPVYTMEYDSGIFKNKIRHSVPNYKTVAIPSLGMDEQGNVVLAWVQLNSSSRYNVYFSKYRNGSWIKPKDIYDNLSSKSSADYNGGASVAVNNCRVAIAWTQPGASYNQIYLAEYR